MSPREQEIYISLRRAATELGVPMAWLKAQADAGDVPSLRCGRMRRFSVTEVERSLQRRADGDERFNP